MTASYSDILVAITFEHNIAFAWPKTFVMETETHILQRRTEMDLFVTFWC